MRTALFDKTEFALALDWRVLSDSGAGRSTEFAQARKSDPKSKALILKGRQRDVAAFVDGDIPSAGAFLARQTARKESDASKPHTIFVVEPLPDSDGAPQFWLCVASEGVVVPGFDAVGTAEEIMDRCAEACDFLDGAQVCVGSPFFAEHIGQAAPISPNTFKDLLVRAPKRDLAAARPKAYGYGKPLIGAGAAALFLVAASIAASYQNGARIRAAAPAPAAVSAPAAAVPQKSPEQAAREAAQALEARREAVKIRFIEEQLAKQKMPLSEAVRKWTQAIETVKPKAEGWQAVSVNCSVAASGCSVNYVRTIMGTTAGLLAAFPSAQIEPTARASATLFLPVEGAQAAGKALVAGPGRREIDVNLASNMQSIKDISYSAKIEALKSPEEAGVSALPTGLLYGSFEFKGAQLWRVAEIQKEVNVAWVFADSLELQVSPTATGAWKLRAQYWLADDGSAPPTTQAEPQKPASPAPAAQIAPPAGTTGSPDTRLPPPLSLPADPARLTGAQPG